MYWGPHFDLMTIVLLSADAASVYISALFFSEKARRWAYRKRWGTLPVVNPQPASLPREGLSTSAAGCPDDAYGGLTRFQQVSLRRNPFEPKPREALGHGIGPQAHRDPSRRPTFRKSTVLQQKIARHERAAAAFVPTTLQWPMGAQPAILPPSGGMPHPHFEPVFTFGQIRDTQPA